jgi:hypothetical protein
MKKIPVRALEVVPGKRNAPEGDARGQDERGDGLRRASEAVAVVSAGALAGGGAGMLTGVALGAINPYALGLLGASAGAVVTVLPKVAGGARWSRWRRWFGG